MIRRKRRRYPLDSARSGRAVAGKNWIAVDAEIAVVGQNSIQRLIDRRVARSAPPMMDPLGRGPALQPQQCTRRSLTSTRPDPSDSATPLVGNHRRKGSD